MSISIVSKHGFTENSVLMLPKKGAFQTPVIAVKGQIVVQYSLTQFKYK